LTEDQVKRSLKISSLHPSFIQGACNAVYWCWMTIFGSSCHCAAQQSVIHCLLSFAFCAELYEQPSGFLKQQVKYFVCKVTFVITYGVATEFPT